MRMGKGWGQGGSGRRGPSPVLKFLIEQKKYTKEEAEVGILEVYDVIQKDIERERSSERVSDVCQMRIIFKTFLEHIKI